VKRPPWLLAVPLALVVAGLLAWLLFSDDERPESRPGAVATQSEVGRPTAPVALPPPRTPQPGTDRPTTATSTSTGGAGAGEAVGPRVGSPTEGAVVVQGRVIDQDGRPIPGAEVLAANLRGETFTPLIALSGADGRFSLDALPPSGVLEVVAQGYARRVVGLDPGGGAVDVVLVRARALEGKVVADEDERPLEGATVEGESATWRNRARTDLNGRFRFDDLPDEQAVFVVAADGRKGVVVEEADAALVRLSRGRAARGRVVGPDGAPVPGALVFVVGAEQLAHPHATRSDGDGRFEVTGLGPEEAFAVLAFGAAKGEELATPLDLTWIEGDGADEATVTLSRLRTVVVRGAPDLALALAPAGCPPGVPAGAPRPGQRDGAAVRFDAVVPGSWQLEVQGRVVGPLVDVPVGEPASPVVVEWPAEPAPDPTASAPRRGVLRVRVVDETGRPVPGASVVVSAAGRDAAQVERQSGPDGLVEVVDPPGGVLTITASVPGRVLAAPVTWDEPGVGLLDLTLARPVTLVGVVRFPVAGVASARLTLERPDGTVVRSAQTGPDGRFRIADLAPGPVLLHAEADGCTPLRLELTLPLGGELAVPLEVEGELHPEGDGHDHDHGPGRG
jgi:hypothetical protein